MVKWNYILISGSYASFTNNLPFILEGIMCLNTFVKLGLKSYKEKERNERANSKQDYTQNKFWSLKPKESEHSPTGKPQ